MLRLCTAALVPLAALAGPAAAQTLIAAGPNALYQVDYATGVAQAIGGFTLPLPHFGPTLCRAPGGALYGISDTLNLGGSEHVGVYSFNEQSGAATLLHQIPLGDALEIIIDVTGAAVHPATGEILFIHNSSLHAVDLTTGQPRALFGLPLGSTYRGLAFAPDGRLYSLRLPSGAGNYKLFHIDLEHPSSSASIGPGIAAIGSWAQILSLTYDAAVNELVAYTSSALSATVALPIDAETGVAGGFIDWWSAGAPVFSSIAGAPCTSQSSFGAGCAAGAAAIPELRVEGCPLPGNTIAVRITKGLGGAPSLLLFGLAQGAVPLGLGCTLLVQPLLPVHLPLALDGGGAATLTAVVPASASGVSFTMQAFVTDGASALGATASNGLELAIP